MHLTPELIEELNILTLYDLSILDEGIKVHTNADPAAIAATKRLHEKGLISLADGGYLTSLGLRAAEQAQGVLRILRTEE